MVYVYQKISSLQQDSCSITKSKYDVYFISQMVPQTAPLGSAKMSLKAENDQHLLLRAGTNRVQDIQKVTITITALIPSC